MSDRSIRETVQHLAGTHQTDRVRLIDATVNEVDADARTCTCSGLSGAVGDILEGVRLMSSLDDGILVIPAVGSTVTIIMSVFTDPIVIGFSEVDKIIFRGGDLGGLPIVGLLVKQLNKMENLLNDLIGNYNSHTHNVTAVGSPTGPSLTPETNTLIPTVVADLENKTITQG